MTSNRPSVGFQQIDCEDAAADCLRRTQRQVADRAIDRAIAGASTTGGVGDPMLAGAIDRADRFVADDKGANIAARLGDVFLDVINMLLPRPKHVQVFQQCLGGVTVVDPRHQSAPGADDRLDHDGIAQRFDRA